MAKKIKPAEPVSAATPAYAAEPDPLDVNQFTIEPVAESETGEPPEMEQPLTSDDHGEPAGRVMVEAGTKPANVWTPGSCINCGQSATDAISVLVDGRYRCARCRHEWTPADEQAPFRRLAR